MNIKGETYWNEKNVRNPPATDIIQMQAKFVLKFSSEYHTIEGRKRASEQYIPREWESE